MKQRIATAVIGLTIFFAILALYQTIFLNISAAVIIFLALHEMFHVTGVWENKALSAVCLLFGCALPFFNIEQARQWLVYGEAVFALAIFGILLFYHESLHYTKAATAFAATSVISYTTSVLIWLRQASETPLEGIYYTLLAFGLAWLTDTGAYLFGITMGKHKLAPKISPKKTVEGAVGGVVFCVVTVLLLSLFCQWAGRSIWGVQLQIRYLLLVLMTPVGALVSMLGICTTR